MEGAVKILFTSPYFDDAIVRIGDKEYLLDASEGLDINPLLEMNVAHLVAKRCYQICGAIFWCIEDAQKFLRIKYVECYKASGLPEPTHESVRELIKYIDLNTAIDYLGRIENDLLPQGKYSVAKEIAQDLHEVDVVRQDPSVLARVERILEICGNESE
jgi:hypothetical protein